jgi:hypothetical protein
MSDYAALLARHHYAILNKVALFSENWHTRLPLTQLVPETLPGDANKMPILLELKSLDDTNTARLVENLQAAQAGDEECLIASLLAAPGVRLDDIRHHLTDRLILTSPQGRVFFRYFDPLVFVHLTRILDAPLLAGLYGPLIRTWTIPFQSEWIALDIPKVTVARLYWAVRAGQRDRLDRIGAINVTLSQWQQQQARPWHDLTEYLEWAERAEYAIEAAQREGLSGSDELSAFALQALDEYRTSVLAGD